MGNGRFRGVFGPFCAKCSAFGHRVAARANDTEDMVVVTVEGIGLEVVMMAEGHVVVDAEAVGVEAVSRDVLIFTL
jgi:hypothetical protein